MKFRNIHTGEIREFDCTGINSSLVSAQNRQRLYWVGGRNDDGTYSKVSIQQPDDKEKLLVDILEQDVQPIVLHNLYGGFKEIKPRIFTDKSPTIRTGCGGGHIPSVLLSGYDVNDITLGNALDRSRKLTVNECMRLQTVPDWYDFSVISHSQAYKCLGNGWTVDVITHLIQSAQIENAPTESQLR